MTRDDILRAAQEGAVLFEKNEKIKADDTESKTQKMLEILEKRLPELIKEQLSKGSGFVQVNVRDDSQNPESWRPSYSCSLPAHILSNALTAMKELGIGFEVIGVTYPFRVEYEFFIYWDEASEAAATKAVTARNKQLAAEGNESPTVRELKKMMRM